MASARTKEPISPGPTIRGVSQPEIATDPSPCSYFLGENVRNVAVPHVPCGQWSFIIGVGCVGGGGGESRAHLMGCARE